MALCWWARWFWILGPWDSGVWSIVAVAKSTCVWKIGSVCLSLVLRFVYGWARQYTSIDWCERELGITKNTTVSMNAIMREGCALYMMGKSDHKNRWNWIHRGGWNSVGKDAALLHLSQQGTSTGTNTTSLIHSQESTPRMWKGCGELQNGAAQNRTSWTAISLNLWRDERLRTMFLCGPSKLLRKRSRRERYYIVEPQRQRRCIFALNLLDGLVFCTLHGDFSEFACTLFTFFLLYDVTGG